MAAFSVACSSAAADTMDAEAAEIADAEASANCA